MGKRENKAKMAKMRDNLKKHPVRQRVVAEYYARLRSMAKGYEVAETKYPTLEAMLLREIPLGKIKKRLEQGPFFQRIDNPHVIYLRKDEKRHIRMVFSGEDHVFILDNLETGKSFGSILYSSKSAKRVVAAYKRGEWNFTWKEELKKETENEHEATG